MTRNILLLTLLTLTIEAPARADAGIPIVSIGFPFVVANLLFVVLIETLVLKRTQTTKGLTKHVFLANLVTTLIGFPIVGLLAASSVFFGMSIGWFIPFPNLDKMHGYIGFGTTLVLVPCYFLSVLVEGKMLRRWCTRNITWKQVFAANLASYLFLLVQVFTDFPVPFLSYGRYSVEPTFKLIELLQRPFETKPPPGNDFTPFHE